MTASAKSLAVVTGGSAGIGRVFADRLARRGHALLLIARDQARLDAAAKEISRAHSVDVGLLAADLSRESEIERVALVLEAAREIGVLVNNAGFGTNGTVAETPLAPQMEMLRLHVLAPMRLSRAVLPGMIQRKTGWLINVSSIASFMHGPGSANYCASKAYLRHFTLALDAELAGSGVRVQALCPGLTYSEFHERKKVDRTTMPKFLWTTADRVVDASLAAIERNGAVVYIPGIRNRILVRVVQMLPQFLVRRGARRARN